LGTGALTEISRRRDRALSYKVDLSRRLKVSA
jgi:hypothetical protein